jgi:protein gp37
MAENSKIEWTDHTFNPWVGCTKVSPACDHCYAESWAKRTGQAELWNGSRRRTSEANWKQPLKWDRQSAAAGRRAKVFCASLADVFDNRAEGKWRADLFAMIRQTPNLDWLLLTKRPQNIAKMLPLDWGDGWPNVWLGTTVENQKEAERRIPALLPIPAAVRFLSCEPLLGRLNLRRIYPDGIKFTVDALTGTGEHFLGMRAQTGKIHWVIVGGESGPGARDFHEYWAEELRDQCANAGTAFFMKQMSGVRKPLPPIPEDLMVREFPRLTA